MLRQITHPTTYLGIIFFLAATFIWSPCHADLITIASYSMENGESGSQTYHDDTYGGLGASGNPSVSGAMLSGGLGQLRNSTFAVAADIFDDEWVGWFNIQPTITLDLGSVHLVDSVGFHASNWSPPFNDVGVPGSALLSYSLDNVTYSSLGTHNTSTADRSGDTPLWVDLPFLAVTARYVRAQLFDGTKVSGTSPGSKPWIFIDEIRAEGISAVPEPSSALLLLIGGAFGFRRQRTLERSTRAIQRTRVA